MGEEGARRWSWVKELVFPLAFPPPLNTQYKLGQPPYFLLLTIPKSKRLQVLRYLPLPDGMSDPHEGPDQDAFIDLLANGEDPDMLGSATLETTKIYEWYESSDEEDVPRRKKKGTKKKTSRRHREFPTLDSFLTSEEGLDRTKYMLYEHYAETLEVLTSDFYHDTLPTLLASKFLILPEKLSHFPCEELISDPNTDLVFSPEGSQNEISTKLVIIRYPQPRRFGPVDELKEDDRGEVPLFALRRRWKVVGPMVLDGFEEDWLGEFKGWILKKGKKEEELRRWIWRSKRGIVRRLSEPKDEQ